MDPLSLSRIVIDSRSRSVYACGVSVRLTPYKFEIFRMLWKARGRPVRVRTMLHYLDQMKIAGEVIQVKMHISQLRGYVDHMGIRVRSCGPGSEAYYMFLLPENFEAIAA